MACALGPAGIVAQKQEGDGGTPAGIFPLRALFYRPDKITLPEPTRDSLQRRIIAPHLGWADDPQSNFYNELIQLPSPVAHEKLWRLDSLYDALVVLGYNDAPVARGRGSCIFLHQARPAMSQSVPAGTCALLPTRGCVALARADLLKLIQNLRADSAIEIALA